MTTPPSTTRNARQSGVVLFSHGSLLCGAGIALAEHAQRLRAPNIFGAVELGYLNYTEPSFEHAVDRIAALGLSQIIVAPFFLVPGYFVSVSLPRQIKSVSARHPGIEMIVADSLGVDDRLADALLASAAKPKPRERWRDGLSVDPDLCLIRDDCPIHGTAYCPTPARPAAGTRTTTAVLDRPRATTTPVTALLVLVHGSPKEEANETMFAVVDIVRSRKRFDIVKVGFMECNSPTIGEAVDACVDAGATSIIATPYFLHMGNHVASDLPDAIDDASVRHPNVEFAMSDHLGGSPLVTDLIYDRILQALPRGYSK
ncbi:MAG TPA: CbiX/SirB N-terminal domain-containing protein [Capsulimonadaceae bacterium]|jgi:sirohydrochlorin cobaltochelatase